MFALRTPARRRRRRRRRRGCGRGKFGQMFSRRIIAVRSSTDACIVYSHIYIGTHVRSCVCLPAILCAWNGVLFCVSLCVRIACNYKQRLGINTITKNHTTEKIVHRIMTTDGRRCCLKSVAYSEDLAIYSAPVIRYLRLWEWNGTSRIESHYIEKFS